MLHTPQPSEIVVESVLSSVISAMYANLITYAQYSDQPNQNATTEVGARTMARVFHSFIRSSNSRYLRRLGRNT